MRKLPVVSGRKIIKALKKKNFSVVSQKGSHVRLKKIEVGKVFIVIVPMHSELAKGTLKSILRQANITLDELLELL
ncbi:MAG: type II toxin-antitoxin system HicA family toxin [archaeon]|nr:type II toxin-antitoxin system HicA family toxin [archaeon]MCP8314593.1 type II toxin-antitoxin system HicA family toxin [archaeon]MCP8322084.1 type II toxin-antitoxin system HicA family toxin [archaeon]